MRSAGVITFSKVSALSLPQLDRRSDTDPFVRWTRNCSFGGNPGTETSYLHNVIGRRGGLAAGASATPKWDGEYTMDVEDWESGIEFEVSVWDYDGPHQAADFVGSCKFTPKGSGPSGFSETLTLELLDAKGRPVRAGGSPSTVTFQYAMEPPVRPAPAPTRPAPPPSLVTRREIRSMSREDQERYAAAVKQMMQNGPGGPETSPFFKLASLHGWPGGRPARIQYASSADARTSGASTSGAFTSGCRHIGCRHVGCLLYDKTHCILQFGLLPASQPSRDPMAPLAHVRASVRHVVRVS